MANFTSSLSTRSLDPILLEVAADFHITIQTAALASSAFAMTLAMVQPVLGIAGDMLGKQRVMSICLALIAIGNFAGAFASSFEVFLICRILCAIGTGGIMPLALGLLGDLVPVSGRQVAMSRVTSGGMSGFLLGASFAGIVGEFFGWRAVPAIIGALVVISTILLFFNFRKMPAPPAKPLSFKALLPVYRDIIRHPHARICFAAVLLEGIFIQGLFPFVSTLLTNLGQPRPAVAGLVIAGFPIGVLIYTMSISRLLPLLKEQGLLLGGGALVALQLILIGLGLPWQGYIFAFVLVGLGYFMMHGCLQSFVSEVAPQARAVAISLHACFIFIGAAIGPAFYGYSLLRFGTLATLTAASLAIMAVGFACSRLLRHRSDESVNGAT